MEEELGLSDVTSALNKKFSATQDKLETLRKESASKNEILNIHKSIEEQGALISKIEENLRSTKVNTIIGEFHEFVEKNFDVIKNIEKNQRGMIEFIPKASAAITTTVGGNATGETPYSNQNTTLGGFNFRDDAPLVSYSTIGSTSLPNYSYTEMEPGDDSPAFVAEGVAKTQIDFEWANRYITPNKVAGYQILTTEVTQDIKGIVSTAETYLLQKHDLVKANAIYFGTGVGQNPKGATLYGGTLPTTGFLKGKVSKPNFMDVINSLVTRIYTEHNFTDEMEYKANICLVNPIDFFINLASAKDTRGLPLYPQASLFDRVTIMGVTIRPWAKIPEGKIFVADMKKYNIMNYIPFSLSMGMIDKQFIKNQFTMIGESRFHSFVRNYDEKAFMYESIATVLTNITKAT